MCFPDDWHEGNQGGERNPGLQRLHRAAQPGQMLQLPHGGAQDRFSGGSHGEALLRRLLPLRQLLQQVSFFSTWLWACLAWVGSCRSLKKDDKMFELCTKLFCGSCQNKYEDAKDKYYRLKYGSWSTYVFCYLYDVFLLILFISIKNLMWKI